MSTNPGSESQEAVAQVARPRIFKITQQNLMPLFNKDKGLEGRLVEYRKQGGAERILLGINSEAATGIVGDKGDIERRHAVYGENVKPLQPNSSLIDSFKQEVRNLLWVIIFVTGIIGTACGLYEEGGAALLGGIFLFVFGFSMILITSLIDYCKDKKFVELQSFLIDEQITVIRGKFGATETISIWDLVVGDIILVSEGQRIPADCVVLESSDFTVDEEIENKFRLPENQDGQEVQAQGEVKLEHHKKAPNDGQPNNHNDPFVRADALTTGGKAKLLVCCTGTKSSRGETIRKIEDDTEDTELQVKLKNLSKTFTLYSIIACLVIFIVLIIMSFVRIKQPESCANTTEGCKDAVGIIFNSVPKSVNIAFVLLVVAVPEGLPLTVGVSLAFSVMRMYRNDGIFLKRQDSLEKIAKVDEFIVGKTSVITTGKMKVKQFLLEAQRDPKTGIITPHVNERNDTLLHCELKSETIQLIQEGILYNNSAVVEMGDTKFVPKGDGTEVGLLKFLQNAEIPIHTLINQRFDTNKVIATVPLRQQEGKFFTACAVRENEFVHIHIKGASDSITNICDWKEGGNAEREAFENAVKGMASTPLRVIAFANAKVSVNNWEAEQMNNKTTSLNDFLAKAIDEGKFYSSTTIVGALGLSDPVRPKAKSAISHMIGTVDRDYRQKGWEQYVQDESKYYDDIESSAQKRMSMWRYLPTKQDDETYLRNEDDQRITEDVESKRICMRMVTGDCIETARAIAVKSGIIDEEDAQNRDIVMEAEEFERRCNSNNRDNELRKILFKLRVLAKATPNHRSIITQALQNLLGKKVAVTGRGIADVDALHRANVGLALGTGCSAAKEVSDMVLADNDIMASLRAVMWGRNIYHNVARFLQFQTTVNISCLLIMLVGPFVLGESPFSACQLLWLNLVMDTLAAFSLGTEPPRNNVADGPPYSNQQLMRPAIWRQVILMSIWNFIVIICVILFVPMTVDGYKFTFADSAAAGLLAGNADEQKLREHFEKIGQEYTGMAGSEQKLKLMTLVFHIFVYLQLFNQINCRVDGAKDYNVFSSFFHNFYFLAVLCGEFLFMFIFPAFMIQTINLNKRLLGGCLMVGATPLLISILVKCTPLNWLRFFRFGKFVDENQATNDNALTKLFDTASTMQVGDQTGSDSYVKVAGDEDKHE